MKKQNSHKINIGILIPHLQSGGAERVASLTSKLLNQNDYNVFIIVYDTNNISYELSGKILDLKLKSRSNLIGKIITRLLRIVMLSFIKIKYKIDITYSFLYSANIVNYYSFGNSKRILTCRGYREYKLYGKKYSKLIDRIDAFVVQTNRMKNDFFTDYEVKQDKFYVISNPFDILAITYLAKVKLDNKIHSEFFKNHTVISFLGAFKRDKGYWHAIKTLPIIKKIIKNVGFVFVGHRGELENDIKKMISNSNLQDSVLFVGYQKNPFKYISKADLFVSTSIFEGFPNAIVEALACNMAIISTDCPTGPREILDSRNNIHEKEIQEITYCDFGVLIPKLDDKISYDIKSVTKSELILARAIIELLNNKNKLQEYKNKSLNRAMDFDEAKYLKDLISVFSVVNN